MLMPLLLSHMYACMHIMYAYGTSQILTQNPRSTNRHKTLQKYRSNALGGGGGGAGHMSLKIHIYIYTYTYIYIYTHIYIYIYTCMNTYMSKRATPSGHDPQCPRCKTPAPHRSIPCGRRWNFWTPTSGPPAWDGHGIKPSWLAQLSAQKVRSFNGKTGKGPPLNACTVIF